MKKIACLLLCCLVCLSAGSCTQKEDSEEAVTQDEVSEEAITQEEVSENAVVGQWQITEWHADHVDQIQMWRIGTLKVEFREDGSIETQLVYNNGDERGSKGTWKRSGDQLEVRITGGGEVEGDEPFERTREFTIDELTYAAFTVRGEIGPSDKPIVLTYKAKRLPN